MRSSRSCVVWCVAASLCYLLGSGPRLCPCRAEEPETQAKAETKAKEEAAKLLVRIAEESQKLPDWDKTVAGATRMEGLFPLYYNQKEQKLFMEIRQDQYDKEVILPIAIARGAGLMYLGGETLNFGDQWLISFRRAADRLLVIRHNVRVRAAAGSPQADAVKVSYTDSVIKALPLKSERKGGGSVLIDLADLFMTDLADIGVYPDLSRSTWAKVKAFPQNVEIEASLVFSLDNSWFFWLFDDGSIPDPRGAQIVVHYGLSMLPAAGTYKPRLADDRVGHFLSVIRDFSEDVRDTPKVRYLTRWNLEKADPTAEKSPPKQPIIFWIERTVPREYRQYVREGILEWNKAFEKVGFIDAIQVRDQQADDEFDPEDIRYNVFRWVTTSAGFAMGAPRTNPKTGEILDADVIFDEGMIRYWRQEYIETAGIPDGMAMLLAGQRRGFFRLFAGDLPAFGEAQPLLDRLLTEHRGLLLAPLGPHSRRPGGATLERRCCAQCQMGPGMQRQLQLAAAVLAARGELDPGGKVPEKLIGQAIKEVVMHEVGHTLGLRHNFKASTALSLEEVNNPEITAKKGNSGSVMDYLPANIAPKGEKQGDYFSPTIGAYDYWAIEYAYKPVAGDEKAELAKIANRAAEPELTFATDEDVWLNPDPRINLFDLGDPLDYAKSRIKLVRVSLDDLQNRVVAKGEGWQRARRAFSTLIGELSEATWLSLNYIGGEYTCRDHRGDPNARPPMKPIDVAKQREAIRLLQDEILSAQAFQFKPELLRYLAPNQWHDNRLFYYYGGGYQFPVLEEAGWIQQMVVSHLLDAETLRSLQEIALHAEPGQEVLGLPEVFKALTDSIWTELPASDGDVKKSAKLTLSTIRRNLEREHVSRLTRLVLGPKRDGLMSLFILLFEDFRPAPPDARSLARQHLHQIDARIARVLKAKAQGQIEVNPQSLAHLEQLHDQIGKVFKASLQVNQQ